MSDLISREEAIGVLETMTEIEEGIEMMYALPTIEAEPVVHGMWIDGGCSNCGAYIPTDSFWDYISERECEFCYSCGAKMDGGVRK